MRKIIFHPALLVLALFGCDTDGDHMTVERIERVERVLMHDTDEFTLMYRPGASWKLTMRKFEGHVTIVDDVPVSQPMWAEAVRTRHVRACDTDLSELALTIHVHSVEDVNGAGWRRQVGKNAFEEGTVEVIE